MEIGNDLEECADCGGSTAAGTADPHVCMGRVGEVIEARATRLPDGTWDVIMTQRLADGSLVVSTPPAAADRITSLWEAGSIISELEPFHGNPLRYG